MTIRLTDIHYLCRNNLRTRQRQIASPQLLRHQQSQGDFLRGALSQFHCQVLIPMSASNAERISVGLNPLAQTFGQGGRGEQFVAERNCLIKGACLRPSASRR